MTATAKLTLWEIPEVYRELLDRAVDPETGEIDELMEHELDEIQEAFETKAEFIALLSREAKAEAAAVKMEEDRLRARRTAAENREKRLKAYLHDCMTRLGIKKVEGERAKVAIQRNGRPSISWEGDPDAIPEAFRRVTVDFDGVVAYETWRAAPEEAKATALPEGFRVEVGTHVRVR